MVVAVVLVIAVSIILSNFNDTTGYANRRIENQWSLFKSFEEDRQEVQQGGGTGTPSGCHTVRTQIIVQGVGEDPIREIARQMALKDCRDNVPDPELAWLECGDKCREQIDSEGIPCFGSSLVAKPLNGGCTNRGCVMSWDEEGVSRCVALGDYLLFCACKSRK